MPDGDETLSIARRVAISPSDLARAQTIMSDKTDAPIEAGWATEDVGEPVFDLLGHIARLEASTGAALALLRRCIVEHETPTREALAAEAEFVFGMPGEAALAEIDQVAEIVGVSSLR
jgi:hypothetical protein